MLQKNDLPVDFKFFTLYFFTFDNFFDSSKAFDCIEISKKNIVNEFPNDKMILIEYQENNYNIQF